MAQGAAIFLGQLLHRLVGLIGVSGVANAAQGLENLAKRQLAVIPTQVQAVVGQVEVGRTDAAEFAQVLFNQPATGGAADAFDQQAGAGLRTAVLDEGLLDIAAVIKRQLIAEGFGQGFGVGGGFAAVLVIAFQPARDNGFGHCLAAWTTHGPRLAEHAGLKAPTGRNR